MRCRRSLTSLDAACAAMLAAACLGWTLLNPAAAQDADRIRLPLVLPKPNFAGTPSNIPPGTTVEKPSGKPRPVPLVPRGTANLALHRKVTSGKPPFSGSLDLITDGDKEAREGSTVELTIDEYLQHIAEREHLSSDAQLRPIFKCQ